MTLWMQILAPASWGLLMFLLMYRFARSEIMQLPVSELIRGNAKVAIYLEREMKRHTAAERQQREMWNLLVNDTERLRARMQISGYWP